MKYHDPHSARRVTHAGTHRLGIFIVAPAHGAIYRVTAMLRYALVFLIVALIAGLLGFTDVAGVSYMAAKILFFVFLVLFVLTLLFGSRSSREVI